ncbi:hypothetical protein [Rhizobium leguminosarum]|uniref:Uncharacterized protein n=1 Tax=Rhizobium leguminosarum TaxID=384 RepID=A0A7K3VJ97_RHILE|nr:hypothetical protein [Rhizobium leguminosarum]NEK16668.1 hypothetical protein [Rhizobium leguminosarum]
MRRAGLSEFANGFDYRVRKEVVGHAFCSVGDERGIGDVSCKESHQLGHHAILFVVGEAAFSIFGQSLEQTEPPTIFIDLEVIVRQHGIFGGGGPISVADMR